MLELGKHIHAFLSFWSVRTKDTSKKDKPHNQELYDIKDNISKNVFSVILAENGLKSYSVISKLQNSGKWVNPPYFAFLRKELSTNEKGSVTCTEGVYPIVFLPENGSSILLAIGFADKYSLDDSSACQRLRDNIREQYNLGYLSDNGWQTDISILGNAYDKWKHDFIVFKEYDKEKLEEENIQGDLLEIIKTFDQNIVGDANTCLARWNDIVKSDRNQTNEITEQSKRKTEIALSISSEQKDEDIVPFVQLIFFGAPGTGKSTKVKELTQESVSAESAQRVYRTTFHPDYDYSSFVGNYKPQPILDKDGKHSITYKFQPQVFAKAYVRAWQAYCNGEKKPIWLVIEEINRGNCAQIFGDLFQLLDRYTQNSADGTEKIGFSKYPIQATADLADWLSSKESDYLELKGKADVPDLGTLCLPPNLNIVATMNTSDQSLFPMDSAFKRRWDWEYIPINYSDTNNDAWNYIVAIGDKRYRWIDFLKAVNPKIRLLTSSDDKQLGTYFITGNLNEDEFTSKVIFYLWSDICKDEYRGNQDNFMRNADYHPASGADTNEFTFNELFEVAHEQKIKILQNFMAYLEVIPLEEV